MKKDLLVEAMFYVATVALVATLWQRPVVALVCCLGLSVAMLYRWHTKSDLVFYFVAFVFGSTADAIAVRFGAWQYTGASLWIPPWLPPLWGIAALLLKRIAETLERRRRP